MKIDASVLDTTEKIIFALRALYQQNGYSRFRMSKFEEYELYMRNKNFLVSDAVITFTDIGGKLMALKPDVTLSIIKNTRDGSAAKQKLFYNETVYRASSNTHTFKEIMQTGVECMGDLSDYDIGSILLLAAQTLNVLTNNYILEISCPEILAHAVKEASSDQMICEKLTHFAGEKNLHDIITLCPSADKLIDLLEICDPITSSLSKLEKIYPDLPNLTELMNVLSVFRGTEYEDRIQIDFSLACDMNYYNGVAFRGFINGVPESVLSGGRYDKLMRRMGRNDDAAGFAVYLDRLERLEEVNALC